MHFFLIFRKMRPNWAQIFLTITHIVRVRTCEHGLTLLVARPGNSYRSCTPRRLSWNPQRVPVRMPKRDRDPRSSCRCHCCRGAGIALEDFSACLSGNEIQDGDALVIGDFGSFDWVYSHSWSIVLWTYGPGGTLFLFRNSSGTAVTVCPGVTRVHFWESSAPPMICSRTSSRGGRLPCNFLFYPRTF